MARLCGACSGLLVFSAVISCGMLAGNPVALTLLRAIVGLGGGFALGSLAGWIGEIVVQDVAGTGNEGKPAASDASKASPETAP